MPAPVAFLKHKHDSNIPKRGADPTAQVLSPLAFLSHYFLYQQQRLLVLYLWLSKVTLQGY